MHEIFIKITFIQGLEEIVLNELKQYTQVKIILSGKDTIYLEYSTTILPIILKLKSITRVFLVRKDTKLNPKYISKHKSLLGELIDIVITNDTFSTYSLSCAGKETEEVKEIINYLESHFHFEKEIQADLKIFIGKNKDTWELGVEATKKPLSQRDYRQINLEGALDPTVAYAINTFCSLNTIKNYLNIFSGSATLLIEAAMINSHVNYIGFDNDKKRTSAAIQNIKKANLIKTVQLKVLDIFDNPNLGTFDVIVSDLPFGMRISKKHDIRNLYTTFLNYCEHVLNRDGSLVVYTTEHETFLNILNQSKFAIKKEISLKIISSVNSYLYPKIYICTFK